MFVALVVVFVVSILGIVAVGSILQPAQVKRDLRPWLDRHANPACEDDDLLPEGASSGDPGRHTRHRPSAHAKVPGGLSVWGHRDRPRGRPAKVPG